MKDKVMDKRIKIAKSFIDDEFKTKIELVKNKKVSEIIDLVIKEKAFDGAAIGRRRQKETFADRKDVMCQIVEEQLKALNRIEDFEKWHKETVEELIKHTTLGVAQKFINLSVKYFYFLEIGYDLECFENVSFKDFENSFHVPIDSYILKWFIFNSNAADGFDDYGNKIVAWSNLSDKDTYYDFLQPKIKTKMKTVKPKLPILCIETIIWSNIKALKDAIEWDF